MVKKLLLPKRKFIFLLLLPVLLLLFPAISMAQVHTVNKGDSIYRICLMYKVNQYALRYNNNLWTNNIYPGLQLNIPVRYTVKQGDSLYLIGKKFGTNVNSIRDINQLKSDIINPGQALYLPSKSNNNTYSKPSIQNVSRGGARLSMADFDLLARIITAEADSESYATQVAVGATVLNRVDSPLFPNSIPGVVYQVSENGRYQFEPVLNGYINKPASESGKKAALDALNGVDPTNGALYFFESWVPNKFLQSRPVSKVMDAFTFSF
jgi:N-acetylmuramoyl-L-alanine amidase